MKQIQGTWQNEAGQPVAGGRIMLKLSQDAVASGAAQVAPVLISFTLDATGSIPANTSIWGNDELLPSGTVYTVSVLAAGGGLVWGAENLSLTGPSPINLNNLIPTTSASGVVFGNAVLLNPSGPQTITGFPLIIPNGTAAAPSLGIGSATTGLLNTAGNVDVVFNSTIGISLGRANDGIALWNAGVYAWSSAANAETGSLDAGLSRISAGVIGVGNGIQGDTSGILRVGDGSASVPSYSFGSGSNTGIFKSGSNLFATIGGTSSFTTTTGLAQVASSGVFAWAASGTGPGYTTDTGFSRLSAAAAALGNGTSGDATGTLKLFAVISNATNPATAGVLRVAGNTNGYVGRTPDNTTDVQMGYVLNGPKVVFGSIGGSTTGVTVEVGTLQVDANMTANGNINSTRINPRSVGVADATSITPNSDTSDLVSQVNTQASGTLTINAPTGTPVDAQKLIIRIRSTNSQTYSFNATYHFSTTVTAPTTLAAGKTDYIGCMWNAVNGVWDVVAVDQGH